MNGIDIKGVLRYLLRHPAQTRVVAIAAWRLRSRLWWRHAPYVPLPDAAYWNFRMMTATGSSDGPIDVRALVEAARWSSLQRMGR